MNNETRKCAQAAILEGYATEYQKRIKESATTLETLDNIAQKCVDLLAPLFWTPVSEGLPDEPTEDARYIFRYKDGEDAIYDYSIEANLWGGFPAGVLKHDEFLEMVKEEFTDWQPITPPKG